MSYICHEIRLTSPDCTFVTMINQTAISARIHNITMWAMEQEKMAHGTSRSKILNEGSRLWINLADARREYRAHQDPEIRRKILNGFLKLWFPEALV